MPLRDFPAATLYSNYSSKESTAITSKDTWAVARSVGVVVIGSAYFLLTTSQTAGARQVLDPTCWACTSLSTCPDDKGASLCATMGCSGPAYTASCNAGGSGSGTGCPNNQVRINCYFESVE